MKRQVSYKWRLREVMAGAGMFAATDLEPHLMRCQNPSHTRELVFQ
jgi:hypothetical protein